MTHDARSQHADSAPELEALQRRPDTPATIAETRNLALLKPDQHQQISAWIAQADSPEEIPNMPTAL